ncbi:MAG: tetratricopeptide repeat protein, partial [Deltaproteobacteria bacterium]
MQDAEGATPPLEQALQIKPTDHEATVLLADAYTLAGKVGEAGTLLDAAIAGHKGRRSKELAALQHRMARVAYAAQDRNVELAWLNVALDSDMQNGQIASELAEVAMELGQNEIALKALRAITLMKAPGPMTRAQAFLRQGMLAQHEGDKRKAVFLAKKALTEDPNLEEAQAFLKQIGE